MARRQRVGDVFHCWHSYEGMAMDGPPVGQGRTRFILVLRIQILFTGKHLFISGMAIPFQGV